MNVTQVTDHIKQIDLLKGVVFSAPTKVTHHGVITVPSRTFKDSGKNEYNLGSSYYVFVAHMYEDCPDKEFFYITIARNATRRNFNCSTSHQIEWNKIYASGSTVKEAMEVLTGKLLGYELK